MEKSDFKVSINNGTFSFTFPSKKLLKKVVKNLYEDSFDNINFYISDYQGSNTYYGASYWEKQKIDFTPGDKNNTYIFSPKGIDFILNDNIDRIKICILAPGSPTPENSCDKISINSGGVLKVDTQNISLLYSCMALHFEELLFFDFSKDYKRGDFIDFLKTVMPQSGNYTCHLFAKTLKFKHGICFSLSLVKNSGKTLHNFLFSDRKWTTSKSEGNDACSIIKKYTVREKINASYVIIFAAIIIIGILYIYKSVFKTKVHLNLPIFTVVAILFLSVLKIVSKKFKVIFGFKTACKTK
jgi:hypothetical protein